MISQTFKEAVSAVWSMVVGLKVTGANFFLPQITTHYPRQVVNNLDTYRGHIDLIPKDEDPFTPKCILCGQCENNCPSGCITIEFVTREIAAATPKTPAAPGPDGAPAPAPKPKKVKELTRFLLDYNLCSLCGLCVQNCPVDSLRFSRDVYLAGFSRGEFEFDLMETLQKRCKK